MVVFQECLCLGTIESDCRLGKMEMDASEDLALQQSDERKEAEQRQSDQRMLAVFFLLIVGVFVGSFLVQWKKVSDPDFEVERHASEL